MLRIVDILGFEEVKSRIVTSDALQLDTAVRAAFGSGMQATEYNACVNLEHRVQTLAGSVKGLLMAHAYRFLDDQSGAE